MKAIIVAAFAALIAMPASAAEEVTAGDLGRLAHANQEEAIERWGGDNVLSVPIKIKDIARTDTGQVYALAVPVLNAGITAGRPAYEITEVYCVLKEARGLRTRTSAKFTGTIVDIVSEERFEKALQARVPVKSVILRPCAVLQ